MIPNDPEIEQAVTNGEKVFSKIGCATCHIPALPLGRSNWIYTEPNPYNPTTNLRVGQTETLKVDLNDPALPQPRLKAATPEAQWLMVPAFTDFKLHDITDPADPSYETLGMNQPVWADKFTGGNRKFLTKRLWGSANEPPFFHHGQFTTLRASVLAHAGEALQSRTAFEALPEYDKDSLIEFLKSLQCCRLELGTWWWTKTSNPRSGPQLAKDLTRGFPDARLCRDSFFEQEWGFHRHTFAYSPPR